jgi:hypothetical protein
MIAFLIITSSSLAFYLGLLVVLYWDGRKRRSTTATAYKVRAGSVAELGRLVATGTTGAALRQYHATEISVRYAETRNRRRRKSQAAPTERAKVITQPMLARGNNDLQCG